MLIFVSSLFPGRFDYHYLVLVVISNRGKKAMEIVPDYFYSLFARVSLSRGKIKNEKKKNQIFHLVSWDWKKLIRVLFHVGGQGQER